MARKADFAVWLVGTLVAIVAASDKQDRQDRPDLKLPAKNKWPLTSALFKTASNAELGAIFLLSVLQSLSTRAAAVQARLVRWHAALLHKVHDVCRRQRVVARTHSQQRIVNVAPCRVVVH